MTTLSIAPSTSLIRPKSGLRPGQIAVSHRKLSIVAQARRCGVSDELTARAGPFLAVGAALLLSVGPRHVPRTTLRSADLALCKGLEALEMRAFNSIIYRVQCYGYRALSA